MAYLCEGMKTSQVMHLKLLSSSDEYGIDKKASVSDPD
jgi:hypothetical protein